MSAVDKQRRQEPAGRTVSDVSDYLTLDEAATELVLGTDALYALIRQGEVVGVKTADSRWLVRRVNVEAYKAGGEQARWP